MLGSGLRGKISIENSTLGTVTACRVTVTHHTLHPATWRQIFNASQTSAHVGGCARRLRQRSSPHAPCVLPSATEPSRRLLHLFGTVCRRQYVHRRHYQFSAEDWRLNFLSGHTAVLPHERLTVLTTMWPHIIVTCPCSPRTLCHVKSIRYDHHYIGLTMRSGVGSRDKSPNFFSHLRSTAKLINVGGWPIRTAYLRGCCQRHACRIIKVFLVMKMWHIPMLLLW